MDLLVRLGRGINMALVYWDDYVVGKNRMQVYWYDYVGE
jgi:hypothetical protein